VYVVAVVAYDMIFVHRILVNVVTVTMIVGVVVVVATVNITVVDFVVRNIAVLCGFVRLFLTGCCVRMLFVFPVLRRCRY